MKFLDSFFRMMGANVISEEGMKKLGKINDKKDVPSCLSNQFTGIFNGKFFIDGCSQDFSQKEYLNALTGSTDVTDQYPRDGGMW